jgi:hypothetical protein
MRHRSLRDRLDVIPETTERGFDDSGIIHTLDVHEKLRVGFIFCIYRLDIGQTLTLDETQNEIYIFSGKINTVQKLEHNINYRPHLLNLNK